MQSFGYHSLKNSVVTTTDTLCHMKEPMILPWLYSPFQISPNTNDIERKRLKILTARRQ